MSTNWYDWAYETKPYLRNKKLRLTLFPDNCTDHDHCEICWARISPSSIDLQSGYYDSADGVWVCEKCATQFRDKFNWDLSE